MGERWVRSVRGWKPKTTEVQKSSKKWLRFKVWDSMIKGPKIVDRQGSNSELLGVTKITDDRGLNRETQRSQNQSVWRWSSDSKHGKRRSANTGSHWRYDHDYYKVMNFSTNFYFKDCKAPFPPNEACRQLCLRVNLVHAGRRLSFMQNLSTELCSTATQDTLDVYFTQRIARGVQFA